MTVRLFAWFTLAWTLLTILVGAVVRATHSGDGCGKSWPSCGGSFVVTSADDTSMLIEFSHRMVSGINLLLVAVLVVVVFRAFAPGHRTRRTVLWVLASILVEAGIGAVIVLYGWVAADVSVARQVSVPLHLVNTLILTGVMALLVWQVEGGQRLSFADAGRVRTLSILAVMIGLVAATGATTSLADTLFPAASVGHGLAADFDTASAFIVRIRVIHPVWAVITGIAVVWYVWRQLSEASRRGRTVVGYVVITCIAVQVGLGSLHIVLLTPLPTALLHLGLAQVLWIAFAFFGFGMLEARETAPLRTQPSSLSRAR